VSAPVNVGDVLAGKYLVERILGMGGMGVVVAARHMQLDEHVAIKFLLPEAARSPVLVARFLREGRAAVKIRSEHVARVLDVGTLEGGAPYMVMEYLEGSDLAAIVRAYGPLPVDEAVDYLLQACEAIAEAHVHGIVHRDLKPSNLFLTTRADGTPAIKVIDFGISKIGEQPSGEMEITGTLEARGSPLFMSPEQMVSTRDVDARSDIWSLGIALYHLVTGEYPFQAPTMPQICGLVLTAPPMPLPDALPDAPAEFEAAIFRCLEKDPADRYQNVAELAQALAVFGSAVAKTSADRVARVFRAAGHAVAGSVTGSGAAGGGAAAQAGAPAVSTRTSSPNLAGAQGGAAGARTSHPSHPSHPPRTSHPSHPSPLPHEAAAGGGRHSGPGNRPRSSSAPKTPPGAVLSTGGAGAVTAGPVVGPADDSGGSPDRRTGQVILAAGIAAVVLMGVTVGVALFFLTSDPRREAVHAGAGQGASPSGAPLTAPPGLAPLGPPAASGDPSAEAAPIETAHAPGTGTATSDAGAPVAPSGQASAPPAVSASGKAVGASGAPTASAAPTASVAPSNPAAGKPTGSRPATTRPKPSVDLFDTPK
jgi:serine/threonine protein kinase